MAQMILSNHNAHNFDSKKEKLCILRLENCICDLSVRKELDTPKSWHRKIVVWTGHEIGASVVVAHMMPLWVEEATCACHSGIASSQ